MHHLTISGFEGGPSLANVQAGLALCPRPRDISFLEGSLRFSPSISLDVSGAGSWYLLDHLNEELQAYGVNTVKKGTVTTAPGPILEQMIADHDIDSVEGFSLETTTDQLIIVSKGDAGLFYGIQLLYQLLHVDGGSCAIPRVKVKDFPRMSIRGLSQDISRGQSPSVDAIKRHVKIMSRFRLNLYQFYMEDMFESKAYPQIGKGRGPLTPQAVKELEEFAKHYHVEIMPIYQNLSHMENVLLDPEIGRLAEFPGAGCLNMADPKIYEFLAKVLGEVACAFSSGKFHIGCDESWDVGMGKSKDFIEHKGMAKALLDHYTWVIKTLKEHGKRQFFLYHDIASKYDEVLAGLPKDDVVMVFWEYSVKDEWKEIDRIASFGVKFVVSSSVLSWTLPFPELARSFLSNRKLIDNGLRKGAIGQINSAWGDNGQENFHENNLMGFSYSAAYSWNPDGCDDATFWKAYARAAFGTDDARIPRLFEALNRIHADFPRRYISKWLGFLWRHPYHSPALDNVHPLFPEEMLMEVSDELVYHEDDMEKQRPLCKEIVSLARECKASTRRNKEGLDYYEFIGNMLEYFINKIQTTAKVTNLLKDGVHPGDAAKVRSLIEPVISQLETLKPWYERLWLRCASRPMVDRIMQFYDWHVIWQKEKIEQVNKGIGWENPYVGGDWLEFPEKRAPVDPRYFRKVFDVPIASTGHLRSAHLQVAPGNFAVAWINGKEIGTAQCGYQGAAPVTDSNIQAWDIKDALLAGKNLVAIEVTCFLPSKPIVNVYIEVEIEGKGKIVVTSDTTWDCSDARVEGWNTSINAPWPAIKPVSRGKPPKMMGEITKPRFDLGLKSKHTHHGYCRILRAKNRKTDEESDLLAEMNFFNGSIL